MSPQNQRHRLIRASLEARDRYARRSSEDITGPESPGPKTSEGVSPPRPGDVLAFPATAELGVLWVLLEDSPEAGALLVAADLHPDLGSRDLALSPDAPMGALHLRCAYGIQLQAARLATTRRTGRLEPHDLERALAQRRAVLEGRPSASVLARETDDEPEYRAWLEEGPARALRLIGADADEARTGEPYPAAEPTDTATDAERIARAMAEAVHPAVFQLFQAVDRTARQPHLGLAQGADAKSLRRAGWGVIFPTDTPDTLRQALQPLIDHRRDLCGAERCHRLDHRPGESWRSWLARHGVAAGQPRFAKVPYYLLLVADPSQIPRPFEQNLGIEYAVGRLIPTEPAAARRYVEWLIEYESTVATDTEAADAAHTETADTEAVSLVFTPDHPMAHAPGEGFEAIPWEEIEEALRAGRRVGRVLQELAPQRAALELRLRELVRKRSRGARGLDSELADTWARCQAFRGLVVEGDPAARRHPPDEAGDGRGE